MSRYCVESRPAVLAIAILAAFSLMAGCTDFEAQQKVAGQNRQQGAAFMAANATKDGVIARPSGLQYMVMREGDGPKPKASDFVTVHYRGTLIDGSQFDSSYDRGAPSAFALNGVIRGWTEGLQLMSVGSKFRLFVPPELGYGYDGKDDAIGPNATLIFEVELLAIN